MWIRAISGLLSILVVWFVVKPKPVKFPIQVMKMKIVSYCVLIMLPWVSVGLAYGCDLDQAERHRKNLQLQKKYPGSKYTEKNHTILIPKGGEEISLNIGGCVHNGVAIELKTKMTNKYNDEAILTKRCTN